MSNRRPVVLDGGDLRQIRDSDDLRHTLTDRVEDLERKVQNLSLSLSLIGAPTVPETEEDAAKGIAS